MAGSLEDFLHGEHPDMFEELFKSVEVKKEAMDNATETQAGAESGSGGQSSFLTSGYDRASTSSGNTTRPVLRSSALQSG